VPPGERRSARRIDSSCEASSIAFGTLRRWCERLVSISRTAPESRVRGLGGARVGGFAQGCPEVAPERCAVVLDVGGRRVVLEPGEATRLRDAAAACAGRSSPARDLSLLLDRALSHGRVLALRRAEAHILGRLASDVGLTAIAGAIAAIPGLVAVPATHEHWSSADATTIRA